ncbi:hypothetical protein I601_3549 [Nocardioides dokdonensis FR1436]|uniref:DUF3105 domain-containing protein n=1 Tax=Nocardioides dokdonensis FR1436 TaxID=1300347 RepID=A0A1A9GR65_9ACTN|nr:DUF3105 domain-containing protein [Nocardioides dokdonensis]ANH39955.1 hypothetical protein I601_3549 [Nocardioides dokdonensis FR1436]
MSEERRDRAPLVALVVTLVVSTLLVGAAVLVPLLVEESVDRTLDDVRVYEDLVIKHVEGDVDYEQDPPVGGPHADRWLDCGVYDTQVRPENVVHDLEHGTVLISYRPGTPPADVDALAAVLPDNGILTPWRSQVAPVVVTVWGSQLSLIGADDPRLALFIESFGAGETAPEPFASCAGGLSDPLGGQDGTGLDI